MENNETHSAKNESFERKIKMKSYGNQTISDNSLLDIGNGIILYPLEGNLIIFDCNICKEINRIFITYSLIKAIRKIPMMDNYLICSEDGHIFILNKEYKILYDFKPKEIKNVYSLDISIQTKKNNNNDKIYQYISISHHSISKEDNDYYLVHTKDALSLIEIEITLKDNILIGINFKKIFTKPSFNNFSLFNYNNKNNDGNGNLELILFHWDEKSKKNILNVYEINEDTINNNSFNEKEQIIEEMITEMKRYKKIICGNNDLKIVILCKRRNMHIFNLNTLLIEDSFVLEGSGEPGEFYVDNEKESILMVNTTAQLMTINISEKINPRKIPLNKNENNLSEIILKDDFIRSMAWGLISIKCKNGENKIFIVNAAGIKIYKYEKKENNENKLIEEYYSTSILKMSGCGACSLSNKIYAYGDLLGNITIFDKDKENYEQIKLENEMVRSICSDKTNKIIYAGTISGKVFKYDYNTKKLSILNNNKISDNNNNNEESITCLRYLHPNLFFSDTGGNLYIYNINEEKIIFNFLAHEPQKDNTNDEFGSLSIKSEIWSFIVHEINDENLYIATGSEDQTIKIWKIKINKEKNIINKNDLIKLKEIKEHKYAVTCLDWARIKYNNEDKEVLLSCSDDKTINIFDSLNEQFNLILKVDFSRCIWGFFTLTYCSFNHCDDNNNNNLLCIGTQAGYLIIYDLSEKKIQFLDKIHYGGIEGVVFENNIISTCGNDNAFNIIEINN